MGLLRNTRKATFRAADFRLFKDPQMACAAAYVLLCAANDTPVDSSQSITLPNLSNEQLPVVLSFVQIAFILNLTVRGPEGRVLTPHDSSDGMVLKMRWPAAPQLSPADAASPAMASALPRYSVSEGAGDAAADDGRGVAARALDVRGDALADMGAPAPFAWQCPAPPTPAAQPSPAAGALPETASVLPEAEAVGIADAGAAGRAPPPLAVSALHAAGAAPTLPSEVRMVKFMIPLLLMPQILSELQNACPLISVQATLAYLVDAPPDSNQALGIVFEQLSKDMLVGVCAMKAARKHLLGTACCPGIARDIPGVDRTSLGAPGLWEPAAVALEPRTPVCVGLPKMEEKKWTGPMTLQWFQLEEFTGLQIMRKSAPVTAWARILTLATEHRWEYGLPGPLSHGPDFVAFQTEGLARGKRAVVGVAFTLQQTVAGKNGYLWKEVRKFNQLFSDDGNEDKRVEEATEAGKGWPAERLQRGTAGWDFRVLILIAPCLTCCFSNRCGRAIRADDAAGWDLCSAAEVREQSRRSPGPMREGAAAEANTGHAAETGPERLPLGRHTELVILDEEQLGSIYTVPGMLNLIRRLARANRTAGRRAK